MTPEQKIKHATPTLPAEREALINELRQAHAGHCCDGPSAFSDAADMLAADAPQPPQAAPRVPMTDEQIEDLALDYSLPYSKKSFVKAIEAHHGITGEVK